MDKVDISLINLGSIAIYIGIGIKILFSEYASITGQLMWYFGFLLFGLLYFAVLEILCFSLYKPCNKVIL